MKTRFAFQRLVLMLFLAQGLIMGSCVQNNTDNSSVKAKVLKVVDKNTMLNIITGMAETMQGKNYSIAAGKKFLATYSSSYKIRLNGLPHHVIDSASYLNVFVDDGGKVDPPEALTFNFYLPKSLAHQLTFADLKSKYGQFIMAPIPEVATTITSSFHFKETPDVSIGVESLKWPEETDNTIERLTVMR